MAGRAKLAAIYPDRLCEAICKGLLRQKSFDKAGLKTTNRYTKEMLSSVLTSAGVTRRDDKSSQVHWADEVHEEDGGHDKLGPRPQDGRQILKQGISALVESGGRITAWDDTTGAELDAEGVQKARETELEFFRKMNAYTRCSRECVEKENGKIIGFKWLDINKRRHREPIVSIKTGGLGVQHSQG